MTVYFQHSNRGKVQILAAYRSPAGMVSTTVTSVEDAAAAEPVVDALNRISAFATATMSTWDERYGDVEAYPVEHLQALLTPGGRDVLTTGEHSLWYEYVKTLSHQAMTDLDRAMTSLPATVRTAVAAEVETEGRRLGAEWQRFTTNDRPAEDDRRVWSFDSPTILFDGGAPGLTTLIRERLDRTEESLADAALEQAVADLRVLAEAVHRCRNRIARLEPESLSITYDPDAEDRHFVIVSAPLPYGPFRGDWSVQVHRWVVDSDYDEDLGETESGQLVLGCRLPAAAGPEEITALLDLCGEQPELVALWAKTPAGEALNGTSFVVSDVEGE